MINSPYFNLIASLIHKAATYPEALSAPPLSAECDKSLQKQADSLLVKKLGIENNSSHNSIRVDSLKQRAIIEFCESADNYYLYCTVISRLDERIGKSDLYRDLDYETLRGDSSDRSFTCLNTNEDETNIIILPKVSHPQRIHMITGSDGIQVPVVTKDAHYWSGHLNRHLQNIFYVFKSDLHGYRLRNFLFRSSLHERGRDYLNIGFAPVTNKAFYDIMALRDDIITFDRMGNEQRRFGDIRLLNPNELEANFFASYSLACRNDIDILFGPEMLGTKSMTETDSLGYNPLFEPTPENRYQTPMLTLTPTYWRDRQNSLSLFSANGKFIAEQFKQHGFEYKGSKGLCIEDLHGSPKEIVMLHIPNLGRIVFPICADFLQEYYRDMLIKTLQACLILCPSYSFGTSSFERMVVVGVPYDVRCIWGNSCSPYAGAKHSPEYPALASTPIISEKSSTVRITPRCNGMCKKACLFRIKIPLIITGNQWYEDNNISFDHLFSE